MHHVTSNVVETSCPSIILCGPAMGTVLGILARQPSMVMTVPLDQERGRMDAVTKAAVRRR